jgi:hypothetical protein
LSEMQRPVQAVVGDLLLLARHTNIVHHIPGRIRLRLLPSVVKVAGGMDLDHLMNCLPGIIKTRVNTIVGSVVIEYDHKQLSPELWESMVKCSGDPEGVSKMENRLAELVRC